jgi:hypothetical protein
MSITDFKLNQVAVEGRYEDAYLLFDATGAISREMKLKWPETRLNEASPQKTLLRVGSDAFTIQITQATLVSAKPDPSLQQFGENAEWFFRLLEHHLKISSYTRLGFRVIFKRSVSSPSEAAQLFQRFKLIRLPSRKVFGAGEALSDLGYSVRFESDTLGATVRISTENLRTEFEPPSEAEDMLQPFKRNLHSVIYDVDYYTIGIVDIAQLSLREWVKQAVHAIRKDSVEFLETL